MHMHVNKHILIQWAIRKDQKFPNYTDNSSTLLPFFFSLDIYLQVPTWDWLQTQTLLRPHTYQNFMIKPSDWIMESIPYFKDGKWGVLILLLNVGVICKHKLCKYEFQTIGKYVLFYKNNIVIYSLVIHKFYSHSNSCYGHLKRKCLESARWKYTNTQTKGKLRKKRTKICQNTNAKDVEMGSFVSIINNQYWNPITFSQL